MDDVWVEIMYFLLFFVAIHCDACDDDGSDVCSFIYNDVGMCHRKYSQKQIQEIAIN